MTTIDTSARVHPTAVIGPNVTIGPRVYIGPHAVIGMHAESYKVNTMEDVFGSVVIEADAIIHELVTVQASTDPEGRTYIGPRVRLQAHSHVGHDARIEHDATISCGVKVGGHSQVGPWVNLGLNAVLHQRSTVEEGVMLGASAFAKGTLPAWRKMAGVPARDIGENTVGKKKAGKA